MRGLLFGLLALALHQPSLASQKLYSDHNLTDALPCILNLVAQQKGVTLKKDIPLPALELEGELDWIGYREATKDQLGLDLNVVINMYHYITNTIYLMMSERFYEKYRRSAYDSLAHELVHYLQFHYDQVPIENAAEDYLEQEAVEHQTWFRETHAKNIRGHKFLCPLPDTHKNKLLSF